MNRRNFFKFLAKGAAIVGAAGAFGVPEVEYKEFSTNDILPKANNNDADLGSVFNGSFSGWCIMGETTDEPVKEIVFDIKKLQPNEKQLEALENLGCSFDIKLWEL